MDYKVTGLGRVAERLDIEDNAGAAEFHSRVDKEELRNLGHLEEGADGLEASC